MYFGLRSLNSANFFFCSVIISLRLTSDTNMSANKDELVPPEWLTVDFVQTALRSSKDGELTVSNLVIKPGSNVGDHFASVMFRIEATVTTGESGDQEVLSLILKTMPFVEGIKMDFLKDSPLFDVEIRMYSQILPAMAPLLATCGIAPFWPTLIYQALEPAPVIIFEDLSKLGYTVPKDPFTFETSKPVFSQLAAIHAISFFLYHVHNFDFSGFNKGLFEMPPEATENFFGKHMDLLIDEMVKWPGFEIHTEKLKSLRMRFLEVGQRISNSIAGGYNVLNHGDFHQKNLLVKLPEQNGSDEGEQMPSDYVLLDYQISKWTSPGLDLVYSLYMMINTEARAHRDQLIEHYHTEFCHILAQLKFDKAIPTLEDLNKEMERFGFFEVMLCVCFLPFMLVDLTKIDDLADFFGETDKALEFKRSMFRNEEYQALVKMEMPRFLAKGYLDA